MTDDVRQWLGEIKALQQKVAAAMQERDEAYASAANWRKLYETEARQRRTEQSISQQAIESLKTELEQLRQPPAIGSSAPVSDNLRKEIEQLPLNLLQEKMAVALAECDRLNQALKAEKAEHATTRQNLTIALGDAIDQLTRERTARNHANSSGINLAATEVRQSAHANGEHGSTNGATNGAVKDGAKTPSLELPTLDQAQSLV